MMDNPFFKKRRKLHSNGGVMHDIEPFYGWLGFYTNEADPNSPFHGIEHNEFFYDRGVYEYLAHPQWDEFGSDGLLLKILYANYEMGYAIIELFGVWNDLIQNDYRLFAENFLTYLIDAGINKYIFIMENVLNIYLDADDYYEAVQDELGDGWICLLRPRDHVVAEIEQYDIGRYFFWSDELDRMNWRKLKPWELFKIVEIKMPKLLE
jgi:hypothetical protein